MVAWSQVSTFAMTLKFSLWSRMHCPWLWCSFWARWILQLQSEAASQCQTFGSAHVRAWYREDRHVIISAWHVFLFISSRLCNTTQIQNCLLVDQRAQLSPVYKNNTQQYIITINCPDTIELPMSCFTTDQPLHYNVTCFKVNCHRHVNAACVLPHVTPSHPEWHPPPSLSHTVTQNAIHHHLVEVQRLLSPFPST